MPRRVCSSYRKAFTRSDVARILLRHWQEFKDVADHCTVCHKCLSPCCLSHDPCHSPMKLQGLTRYGNDLQNGLLEADYIVVEMANQILGEDWMPKYVAAANSGGIERVLV